MRGIICVICFVVAATAGAGARAQVSVHVAAPTIRFEVAPPLVVVSPGVQVVPDYYEEVFFVDGWYWCRRGDVWFRTRDYRGGWVIAERHYVPVTLVKIPPGHYKHYKVKKMKAKHGEGPPVFVGGPPGPPGEREVVVKEKHGGDGGKHGKGKGKK